MFILNIAKVTNNELNVCEIIPVTKKLMLQAVFFSTFKPS